jgi:hypothetical protein
MPAGRRGRRRERGGRDGMQSRPDTYASADVCGPRVPAAAFGFAAVAIASLTAGHGRAGRAPGRLGDQRS